MKLGDAEQWNTCRKAFGPEERLAMAVLEDGIDCLLKPSVADENERHDAYRWVFGEEQVGPFSFIGLCQLFKLNSSSVRRVLIEKMNLGEGIGKARTHVGRRWYKRPVTGNMGEDLDEGI